MTYYGFGTVTDPVWICDKVTVTATQLFEGEATNTVAIVV